MSSIDVCHSTSTSQSHSTFDFEGLEESLVDNNEDEDDDDDEPGGLSDPTGCLVSDPSCNLHHNNLILIRDALIRDSANRSEDDIDIIVSFLSIINSNHDHMTRKRLAPHFVLAEIETRDTRVLTHGEKLDAYCIVAAGSLRHVLPCEDELLMQDTIGSPVDDDEMHQLSSDPQLPQSLGGMCSSSLHRHHHQNVRYLQVGDEFGAHLDDRVVYGEIFTNEPFVWVLCVPHLIFDQICGEKTFQTIRDERTGNIIEMRTNYLPVPPGTEASQPETCNHVENDAILADNLTQVNCGQHYLAEEYTTVSSTTTTNTAPNAAAIPPKSLALTTTRSHSTPSNDTNELIRATKDRLYELVLNSEPSETFVEDFLLTFRIWSEKDLSPSKDSVIMHDLMNRICGNISNGIHVENCVRIVLIWMVNHFQDFNGENRILLDQFENILKNKSYKSQSRLFHMNLSAKSMERQVTITRSDRNSSLPFSLIGGYECGARLFIGEVFHSGSSINSPPQTQSSPVTVIDLRPGDRVISINGVDCHVMPIGRAHDLCRSSTHLSLQVKYDPHLFNALIEGRYENKRQIVETFPLTNRLSTSMSISGFGSSSVPTGSNGSHNSSFSKDGKKETSSGNQWKQKMRSLMSMTTNQLISSTSNILNNSHSFQNQNSTNANQQLNNVASSSSSSISSSNSSTGLSNSTSAIGPNAQTHPRILSYEVPEIIKIYLFETNDCRFLPIHSSTTARECIQLALREFQLTSNHSSRDFALYEYSVIFNSNNVNGVSDESSMSSSTVVKRLSDGTSDLVNNLGLNSRLYLKLLVPSKDSNNSSNGLTDNEIAKEIIKDASINSLLELNVNAIAREMTARDFRLFCKIEAQQFVYDLAYNDSSGNSTAESSIIFERTRDLQEFERKTNEEMFWTINQVLAERRSPKRVKVIKQLIRIANVAMKLNNFNTLFAIISGLNHLSVSRLKSCWDKVPSKVLKKFRNLQELMDPSRNFYNFRQKLMEILRQDNGAYIIIPFFPLVKKDLSFIWLANQTYVNSAEPHTPQPAGESKPKSEMLVNWEKMRLLSEKIREIQKMTNTTSLALAAVNGLAGFRQAGFSNTSPSVANEPIDPNLLFRIFADATTSEDPRTFSHKRLWDNQRMMKRVQSFLNESFSSITSDEHVLMSRSYSCELPQTPSSSHATTRSSIASTMSSNSQLSHPSPTPSSASSSSNSLSMHSDGAPGQLLHRPHKPRFGQTSPNQLRKLLALSDGAVIVPHSSNNHNHGHNHSSGNNHLTSNGPSVHTHSHHQRHYSQHSMRSSNSSLNSNLSGSTNNYYNSIYGCQPHHSYSGANNGQPVTGNFGNGNGSLANANNYLAPNHHHHHHHHHQQNKVTYGSTHSYPNSAASCCTGPTSQLPSCCPTGGAPQSGALYPSQAYCSCCTPSIMRPSSLMPIMTPQTSGLMHPNCGCSSTGGNNSSSNRRQASLPPKQPLPVESSSVTSFRRLEQYQQITRYREIRHTSSKQSSSRRPQCPDYDTTMQRICAGGTSVTINGTMATSKGNHAMGPTGHHSHRTNTQHHREDIV